MARLRRPDMPDARAKMLKVDAVRWPKAEIGFMTRLQCILEGAQTSGKNRSRSTAVLRLTRQLRERGADTVMSSSSQLRNEGRQGSSG